MSKDNNYNKIIRIKDLITKDNLYIPEYQRIKSNSFGDIKIISLFRKGGVVAQLLLYKDGTTPR